MFAELPIFPDYTLWDRLGRGKHRCCLSMTSLWATTSASWNSTSLASLRACWPTRLQSYQIREYGKRLNSILQELYSHFHSTIEKKMGNGIMSVSQAQSACQTAFGCSQLDKTRLSDWAGQLAGCPAQDALWPCEVPSNINRHVCIFSCGSVPVDRCFF